MVTSLYFPGKITRDIKTERHSRITSVSHIDAANRFPRFPYLHWHLSWHVRASCCVAYTPELELMLGISSLRCSGGLNEN